MCERDVELGSGSRNADEVILHGRRNATKFSSQNAGPPVNTSTSGSMGTGFEATIMAPVEEHWSFE